MIETLLKKISIIDKKYGKLKQLSIHFKKINKDDNSSLERFYY